MSKRNDDENEMDSCVFVGTPLADLLPEDAKFSVKPKRPEEQIVTDERGRQRFHGAFTGGFSAGYFNTVGSKEGWAPASFKSSRSDKSGGKTTYRPEDFMDEEDFNDYGIAPRGLQIKSDYKDQYNQKDASLAPRHNKSEFALENLIRPVESTIGVKMLRRMGWREGQGIGPKIKRKLRKLKSKANFEPGRKIYGVALPPDSESDQEDDELEDDYFVSTFDINDFQFQIKEDVFGLGYKRLNVNDLFGKKDSTQMIDESPAASLLFPMGAKSSKKKGITGQSFGFGEYEDEDDIDVYKQDNLEMYDFELNSAHQRDQKKLLNKSYGFAAFEDDVTILKKFSVSKKKLEPSRTFEGPQVPADFDLMHKFPRHSRFEETTEEKKEDEMKSYLKSISSRSELLGEQPIQPKSIFDLISQKDKEKIEKIRSQQKNLVKKPDEIEVPKISVADDKIKKEKRYEIYVSYAKKNHIKPYSMVDSKGMTDLEKEKEMNEFEKRYSENLKKIELLNQSSRFVSIATLNENNQEIEKPEPLKEINEQTEQKLEPDFTNFYDKEEQTDMHKAAIDKKYGKLTRTEYEWRPNPILCKRYNIPNPYKDTKEYGTVKDESEKKKPMKFSLFNIMTAESRFDKGKSKSLFDEINAETPLNKSNILIVKTVKLPTDESQSYQNEIEFESKKKEESEKPSNFFEKNQLVSEPEVEKTISNENVYLQERPEFDMFKAIFEDEDDNQFEENIEELEVDDLDKNEMPEKIQEIQEEKTIIPSSFSKINVEKVNHYLDDKADIIEIDEVEPVPEATKFTQLVKELVKKKSDSTSDSSRSSSGEEEIIYEEVSASPGRSAKKKDKSKKKKKQHKKKKSKKSHKKK